MSGTFGKSNPVFGIVLFVISLLVTLAGIFIAGTAGYGAYSALYGGFALAGLGLILYAWFWVWAIIAIGNIAAFKGYSKAGFVVFAILLPIVALIVVLILQPSQAKQNAVAAAQLVACPACAELVQPKATKCRYCGEVLTA